MPIPSRNGCLSNRGVGAVSVSDATIEERNDACFIVSDKNGRALAYVYFEDEPGRRAAANLTDSEVRTARDDIKKGIDHLHKLKLGSRPSATTLAAEP